MRSFICLGLPIWRTFCAGTIGIAITAFSTVVPGVFGQAVGQPSMAAQVLTNIGQIWTMPADQRSNDFRIRTEVVIYFIDKEWANASGECMGTPRWLPIFDSPYKLKAGERVAIDGVINPQRERFVWSKTRVHILENNVPLKAEVVSDLSKHAAELKDHLISVKGLIDTELDEPTHCIISFLSGDTVATAYVLKGTNHSAVPFKQGDFVRMKCVYSPQFDRDGNMSVLSLWVDRPADVQVIGSLATDKRFNLPLTLSKDIQPGARTDTVVRVEGIVRKYEPGRWVAIWDATGQITVESKQTQPLRTGDRISAIGYPYLEGVERSLHNALYRVESATNTSASDLLTAPHALPLCLAEEVRDLSPADAARHLPVHLHAIVTWSHASTPFAYVQDASGGIRVVNPKWDKPDTAKPGTIVLLDGVTSDGNFVPVVTNAFLRRNGWWNIEGHRQVTLEQAMTGVEEGDWVGMRGFVKDVSQTNGLAHFILSTTSGDFQAWTPAVQSFDSYKGAIVQVQGVCSALANARHQLTGIQIWTPDQKFIQIEEPAPYDPFAVPFRPLADLRRFNVEGALNQRVRTSGTVVLDAPGHYLYVQDGVDSVLALSAQTNSVQPGDHVEVVGFPGEKGQKFVLREAAYRRIAGRKELQPLLLSAMNSTDANLDGLLVKADGILMSKMQKNGGTRLLLQGKGFIFEASLASGAVETNEPRTWETGSRLALTGVYETQSDENGKPRSFLLHLRSKNDIQVLQRPPWWTLERLLWALVGTLAVFFVALIWGMSIARRNTLLHQAQTELEVVNSQLENRVEERTRELQDQVTAKERARTELAQAQRDLMLASRQAGMAEVATGVLHNVGNVLNSVNVSVTLLTDQVRKSESRALLKTADLLKQQNGNLGTFLCTDPRGKLVPEFIVQVAEQIGREQESTSRELEQLTKNIDHLKDVIATQQSYARVAGVIEKVALTELLEDALQINAAALVRHDVNVVRQFEEVPPVMVDKHKVLQILVNLIRNAKYALDEGNQVEKVMTITIARADNQQVMVRIADNGVGIPAANLTRIFSHGFTTRPHGHGFGLHLGALSAREMGGSLTAASEGENRGATFTLILPLTPPRNNL